MLKSFFYNFLIRETGNTYLQAARYFIFGTIPTVVDMGLLWVFKELFGTGHLLVWTAVAFIVATLVQYLFSIKLVFNSRNVSSKTLEILVFFAVRAGGLAWTELLMWVMAVKGGMNYMLAKFIIVILVFLWNFSMNKVLLFRNKK